MADDITYKTPEYIVLNGIEPDDPEYPEIAITDKARIPVIALSYSDKDIAVEKELLIDYEKGGIYVVDAKDRRIIHDLSKLIAENYLDNINGDNTYITIEGIGLINLADILRILWESRIELRMDADEAVSLPEGVTFDNASVTIAGKRVEVYGFHAAKPLSTPRVSEDGKRIEWVGGVEEERPGGDIGNVDEPPGGFEPPLGAKQNVLYIYPKDDTIILYNKPQQYTPIKEALSKTYTIKFPLTMMQYSQFYGRLDASVAFNMTWPNNLTWLNPRPNSTAEDNIYIFECQTWDYGNTWIISYINYAYIEQKIEENLPSGVYFTDENGNLLTNPNNTFLSDAEGTAQLRADNPTASDSSEYTTSAVVVNEDGDQSTKIVVIVNNDKA